MTPVDFAHTRGAQQNREAKAGRLANLMIAAECVRPPRNDKERRNIERGAGTGRASDETWARAVELWQQRRGVD